MSDSDTTTKPLVVDLGRATEPDLDALKVGAGPLVSEVDEVVERVREALGERVADRRILPVVVVYRTETEGASR